MRQWREWHLVVAGDCVGRGSGVGVGAANRSVGNGSDSARRGDSAGDVKFRQRAWILLVARLCLQDDAVLIGLAVDGGNFPLAESGVEGGGETLHNDSEGAGLLPLDLDIHTWAALLPFCG